ncbi:hypothetical protein T01_15445 [Trichinella spiralis]|uniref:Uncharacterized protein n=1 Tax=Trichinella spiralis TaxID=6334 RepID=A0A0V1B3I8_TRISP|nr:hypothetical protein T01_7465 [Trichinella spiralis]KRY31608.1 hypothetical protein T01_15445 [Trichinella spiralis]
MTAQNIHSTLELQIGVLQSILKKDLETSTHVDDRLRTMINSLFNDSESCEYVALYLVIRFPEVISSLKRCRSAFYVNA